MIEETILPSSAAIRPPCRALPNINVFAESGLLSLALRTLIARGLGPISSFALTVLLARTLGAEGTGVFYVGLTLVTISATVAKFGLDTALQRHVGAARGRRDSAAITGIYRQAILITICLSIFAAGLLATFAASLAGLLLQDLKHTALIQVMSLTVVPYALLGVHAAMFKALGQPVVGGFLEAAALPGFTLALVMVALLFAPPSTHAVGVSNLAAAIVAIVVGNILLRRAMLTDENKIEMSYRKLISSCLPLTLVELINYGLIWSPFLFLAAFTDPGEAGIYSVAHRLALQLGLVITVFSSIVAPHFAAHFEANDNQALAELASRTTRMMFFASLPISAALLIWPAEVLHVFGSEFEGADKALQILVLGQVVNLATGPVGYVLAMTGHEKILRNALFASVVITAILAYCLIPPLGAIGAAFVVAVPMAFTTWSAVSW